MKQSLKITCLLIALFLLTNFSASADGTNNARVRVIHAVPGGSAVDVYVVNQPQKFANISYTQVTNYVEVPPTNATIRVFTANTPPDQPPIMELTTPLEGNKSYRIILSRNQQGQPKISSFEENNSPTPPNKARVTFIHLAPDMPNIDICTVGQPTICFMPNIGFEGSQTAELDSGGYNLEVHQSGTGTNFLPITDTYQDGQAYTVFIMGQINADPRLQTVKTMVVTRNPTPSNTPRPPGYPPHTGALLAPEVAVGLAFISMLLLASGLWVVRRRFS